MNTCPHCGSKQANGDFECGSMRVGEDVVQTRFCHYVTDFRKPIDAELQTAKARIDALEKAGDAMACDYIRGEKQLEDWIKAKEAKP